MKKWRGVGEEEDGWDHGLEEDLSAIYHHGLDQDGCSDSEEASADGGGDTPTIHGSARGSHGFQDGGGLIHGTGRGELRCTGGMVYIHGMAWAIHGTGTVGAIHI